MQKLQDQEERAESMKGQLRWKQQELRVRLQKLQAGASTASERIRNDSLGSVGSVVSSERSDSDRGEARSLALSDKHKCWVFPPQQHTLPDLKLKIEN